MGYRTKYIIDTVGVLQENPELLDRLSAISMDESEKELMKLKGVGIKVASCISLFALNHYDTFPIDRHIQRVIDEEYNGTLDISKYKGYAGLIQQYMFFLKIQ